MFTNLGGTSLPGLAWPSNFLPANGGSDVAIGTFLDTLTLDDTDTSAEWELSLYLITDRVRITDWSRIISPRSNSTFGQDA